MTQAVSHEPVTRNNPAIAVVLNAAESGVVRLIALPSSRYAFAVQYSPCFARTLGLRYLIKYHVPMPIMNRPLIGPNEPPATRANLIATDSTPSMIHNVPAVRGRRG
jgi:hypothetical protein